MYDIVIIGAGPSGSYAAYLLSKEDYSVLVLDKGSEVKDSVICTGIVSEEAFQKFLLPKDSILNDIRSAKFISPSGNTFRYQHDSPFAYVVDRIIFDSSILKQALNKGATFLPNSYVERLKIEKNGVEVLYKHKSETFSVNAKTVIVASGVGSSTIEKIGLKEPINYLQGIQTEVKIKDLDEVEIYLGSKVSPGSFAWVVPLNGNTAKIGLTIKDSANSYIQNLLSLPSIKKRLSNERFKIGYRPVVNGMALKTYSSRILSVGDAAGQVKTTTGGGIYYGLIGTSVAVQTIVDAFNKGNFSESHFRLYEKRWREILEPEIITGLWLKGIYRNLGDKKIDYLIDLAQKDGVVPLIRNKAKFDWQKNFFLSLLQKLNLKLNIISTMLITFFLPLR